MINQKTFKVGDKIKVTDTFLTRAPYWTGEIIEINKDGFRITWYDDHDTSFYSFEAVNSEDAQKSFKVIKETNDVKER